MVNHSKLVAMISWKKAFIFIALGTLLWSILFWNSIITYGFEKFLTHFTHRVLDSELLYESIHYQDQTWFLKNPRLNNSKSVKEGGIHFSAESLAIKIVPHLWKGQAEVQIDAKSPVIDALQSNSNLKNLLLEALTPAGLFTIRGQVAVDQGIFNLHKYSENLHIKHTLYFQLAAECYENGKGCLKASLDDPTLQNNFIQISLENRGKKHFVIDLNFEHVDCASCIAAASSFYPNLQELNLEEGTLKGKMVLTLPKEGGPFADGELSLHNAAFTIPAWEVKGQIKEAKVYLSDNGQKGTQTPPTIGHIELAEPASLTFNRENSSFCQIENVTGSFYFQTLDGARLNLQGTCFHHDERSALKILGESHFSDASGGSLNLQMDLNSPHKETATARFVTRELGSKFKFVEISLLGIGPKEFDLLQMGMIPRFPAMRQARMIAGRLDATVLAYAKGFRLTDFKIEKVSAKDLEFAIDPWDLDLKLGSLSGSLAVNLSSEKMIDTLNADLNIEDGQLSFAGFNNDLCRLSDVQTNLIIRQGLIHQSIVQGEFAGLKGTVDIDGLASDGKVIKLKFTGGTQGLSSLAPELLRLGLKHEFAQDLLTLNANMHQTAKGMQVQGNIAIQDRETHLIDFGFELEKASSKLWNRWPAHHTANHYWHEIGTEATLKSLPALAAPLAFFQAHWLRRELGCAGIVMRNGWFEAKNLPLEKYVAPFLFPERDIKLRGFADFQGLFDHDSLTVNYGLNQFSMESANALFEMKTPWDSNFRQLPGSHYLDFDSGVSYGTIPLVDALFYDKRNEMAYEHTSGLATFNGKKILLSNLKTNCCGLSFGGKLDFDFSNNAKALFDVDIQIETVEGRFTQLQKMFDRFEKLKFFQKIPLDGQLVLKGKGARLKMAFSPQGVNILSYVEGSFKEGMLINPSNHLTIKKLTFNFHFDQGTKQLLINDIHGKLFVGQEDHLEEYQIAGEKIHFTDIQKNESEFDLWIADQQRDILRLVGQTEPFGANSSSVAFILDKKKSHFGDIYPEDFHLVLNEGMQLELLKINFALSLDTILHDLQAVSRTKLLFLPQNLLTEVNSLKKAAGFFNIQANYDSRTSLFSYRAKGEEVSIGNYIYKKCSLTGKKKGATLSIDQLVLDDMSISADLMRLKDSWKVNFLGMRFGESILVGLEGDYRDGDKVFDAKINLLEVNLCHLNEWPALRKFVLQHNPKGTIRATGQVKIEATPAVKYGWQLDALIHGSLKSWEISGLTFQDASNVSFHFVTERGLTLRNLHTAIKDSEEQLASLNAAKIDYDSGKEELTFEEIHFDIPVEKVKTVTERLQKSFPETFTDKVNGIVQKLKEAEPLQGAFSLTKSPTSTLFEVYLKDGNYFFNNRLHPIKNFVLKYDLKEFKIFAQYSYNQYLLWLLLKTKDPTFTMGTLTLADQHPEQQQVLVPLEVTWNIDPVTGFNIHNAQGHLAGMTFNIHSDPEYSPSSHALHLIGTIHLIPSKASALISDELSKKLTLLQVNEGYALKGRIRLDKDPPEGQEGNIHFHGHLDGRDFTIKGYHFHMLTSHISYVPGKLEFKDIRIQDPSGAMYIEHAYVYKDLNAIWQVGIPRILITDFRPSFLREVGTPPISVGKPLIVQTIDIQNITGNAADTQTLLGKGTLQFSNPPKKNLQNTIFAIPAELLTLIGLNLTVLNPVSGTVHFDIHDGKFYITKFKDIYSEGHLSKFHLSHRNQPSYVDFEGNIHVLIRMKQYNLFFKLAELFTFNIQGTLTKPTYSLNKQSRSRNTQIVENND